MNWKHGQAVYVMYVIHMTKRGDGMRSSGGLILTGGWGGWKASLQSRYECGLADKDSVTRRHEERSSSKQRE